MPLRCFRCALLVVTALTGTSLATPVVGKLDLPPAPNDRPPVVTRGFLDRTENPNKPVRSVDVGPYLVVALFPANEAEAKGSISDVRVDLVGESFARAVVGVPIGADVVIKNFSKTARTIVAAEDPKLIPDGPINPTGEKRFKIKDERTYTIGEKDTPHLKSKLIGVKTPYVTHVEVTGNVGKFDLSDVPDGAYKLRVFYKDSWIAEEAVTVQARAKNKPAEISVKVAAFTAKK